jgi:threonyl-tRNA synthetase
MAIQNPEQLEQMSKDDRLYRMRHSAAHVMAEAMLEIFPDAKVGIGPPIDTGFYYDFELPRSLTPEDLEQLEARMRESIAANHPFERSEVSKDEARRIFAEQPYKLEIIEGIAGDTVSLYRQGPFLDLCEGPHVGSTAQVPPFKLMSIAGAYWRGNEHNPMLQRVYGALFETRAELDQHLEQLEEARRRDHRRLGRELGLFAFSEDVGPGLPLFLPKGEMLRHLMEGYVREVQTRHGYQHVWTGNLVKAELFMKSGHWEHFRESMFPPMVDDQEMHCLKPMNCPSHMALYNTQLHSYRELPLRYAEFATLYRYEKSGELAGLTRVRSLTQDDAHIFCTEEQIQGEFARALAIVREVLGTYDMTGYHVRLSLRDPESAYYVQDDDRWQRAEQALQAALDTAGVEYTPERGEAAFYGPKADFIARDALGREWQLSTIQVDLIQPSRLGCEYIGEDGQAHMPVMLHRAVIGSTERFLGVLIEHYAGAFPTWLAPVQAMVIPIADRHLGYAQQVADALTAAGLRPEVDGRTERMNLKIRQAQLQKVPYMLVVGDKEAEAGTVSVRIRNGENPGAMPLPDLIERLQSEARSRERVP